MIIVGLLKLLTVIKLKNRLKQLTKHDRPSKKLPTKNVTFCKEIDVVC